MENFKIKIGIDISLDTTIRAVPSVLEANFGVEILYFSCMVQYLKSMNILCP